MENIIGKKFGKLTIVCLDEEKTKSSKGNRKFYLCKCDCGNLVTRRYDKLVSKGNHSCSCYKKNRHPANYDKNLIGKKFGRLKVISDFSKNWEHYCVCVCDCGKEKVVNYRALKSGNTKSCGCYLKEKSSQLNRTHGLSNKRIYKIWKGIKNRCKLETIPCYKNYGGRGICICDEWKNDFISFYNWSMANGYREDLTIDRIDVNGNYCPENCRWATYKEQSRNTRNNHIIEYNGESHCLSEWEEIYKLKKGFLAHFLRNHKFNELPCLQFDK